MNPLNNSLGPRQARRPNILVRTPLTTNTNEKSQINSCLRKAFKVLQILSMPLQVAADGVEKLAELGKASKPALNSLDAVGHSLGIVSAPLDMCFASEAAASGDTEKATFIGAVSATSATMSTVGLIGMGALAAAMLPVVTGLDFAKEVYSTFKISSTSKEKESVNTNVEILQDPMDEIKNLNILKSDIRSLSNNNVDKSKEGKDKVEIEENSDTIKNMEIGEFKLLLSEVPSELKGKLLESRYRNDITPLQDEFSINPTEENLTDQNITDIQSCLTETMKTKIIDKLPKNNIVTIKNMKIGEFKSLLSKVPSDLKDKLLESRYGNDIDINNLLKDFSINITKKNLTDQNKTDIQSCLTERVKTKIIHKVDHNIVEKQNALDTNRKIYLKEYTKFNKTEAKKQREKVNQKLLPAKVANVTGSALMTVGAALSASGVGIIVGGPVFIVGAALRIGGGVLESKVTAKSDAYISAIDNYLENKTTEQLLTLKLNPSEKNSEIDAYFDSLDPKAQSNFVKNMAPGTANEFENKLSQKLNTSKNNSEKNMAPGTANKLSHSKRNWYVIGRQYVFYRARREITSNQLTSVKQNLSQLDSNDIQDIVQEALKQAHSMNATTGFFIGGETRAAKKLQTKLNTSNVTWTIDDCRTLLRMITNNENEVSLKS